ncbi:hypothetical protein [Micromonospora profundi]|uniref:hypothetical protein n=1 Tax=Micromonospora profundi TaxID=1420889 RepID=UPI003657DADC
MGHPEPALNRGTYVAPDAGKLRFGDYAQRWLSNRNEEKATAAREASIMRNHVVPRCWRRSITRPFRSG